MCGNGVFTQVISRGLFSRGKVAMCSRRDHEDVPCASLSRANMAGKACSPASFPTAAPSVARVSGVDWVCCAASTGGGYRKCVASGAWMDGAGRSLMAPP